MKKIVALVVFLSSSLVPSLTHAGGTPVTLSVSAASTSAFTGYSTTIDFAYSCNLWTSGGTLQLYIVGGTPTNIGDPQPIPDISLTSYQFSGTVSVTFPTAGVYQVSARVSGTDATGTTFCDRSTVNSGTPVTITVSDPSLTSDSTTTTVIEDGMPERFVDAGSNSGPLVMIALALIGVGIALISRRRFS